jgi:hypothetical protein
MTDRELQADVDGHYDGTYGLPMDLDYPTEAERNAYINAWNSAQRTMNR